MSNTKSGHPDADGASLVEIAKYEALATIVSEYLRHPAAVYQATVDAEGGRRGDRRSATVRVQLG